jgi:ribosome-associated protein
MDTTIIEKEIRYRTSRSSGKGGQHVNKVETRVELLFDVAVSEGLNSEEKALVLKNLSNRISSEGVLQFVSEEKRSQRQNKIIVFERFLTHLQTALIPEKVRLIAAVPVAVQKERLKTKRHVGQKKAQRKKVNPQDIRAIDLFNLE